MTIQKAFGARGEDASIVGKSQTWSYSDSKFRKSLTMEFHPSSRCNFSCRHCQGLPYRGAWKKQPPRMSTEFVDRFFVAYDGRKDTSVGMWRIIISGMTGDPTLNPSVTRLLLRGSKDRGVATGLSTNGIALKQPDLEILTSENTPNDWLNLSLDSPIGTGSRLENLYQRVHGSPRSDGLPAFSRILEEAAEMKYRKGSELQINIDWIISDLSLDPGHIEEDVIGTIAYLNSIPGVSLLRMQLPFYLHDQVPGISDENNIALAIALKKIQDGEIAFKDLREDFFVKLRKNWYKRLSAIRKCTAGRDYGVVFGPDEKAYFCPYTATPAFEGCGTSLPQISAENIWDNIEKIKTLDVLNVVRCQVTCTLKNCFAELGIVR